MKKDSSASPVILHGHFSVGENGHLTVGGADTVSLAKEYGTPLYLLDENVVRANMRTYLTAARTYFGEDALPLYASKALSFTGIYRIAAEEGMGVDCVSCGEIHTALHGGFPAEKIYFHGNNKTDADIRYAVEHGVGTFVVDSFGELERLSAIAGEKKITERILLRLTPGIDPHTHKAITTGNVDSKFGEAIDTGAALAFVKAALKTENVRLVGFHCHIGSQIFEIDPFVEAARKMSEFIRAAYDETGFLAGELNLGGGLGVRYVEEDPVIDYADAIRRMSVAIRSIFDAAGLPMPKIILEPGRSLVAAAGCTLYTVGSVKEIPGFRTYVSIDGGMPDNPRYALYGSRYTALVANKAGEPKDTRVTLAGRCCESGDLIGEDMPLQKAVPGDLVAVLVTGAYNYSMASNYNRIPRPPIVLIRDGNPTLAVRRETFDDLTSLDL